MTTIRRVYERWRQQWNEMPPSEQRYWELIEAGRKEHEGSTLGMRAPVTMEVAGDRARQVFIKTHNRVWTRLFLTQVAGPGVWDKGVTEEQMDMQLEDAFEARLEEQTERIGEATERSKEKQVRKRP